MNIKKETLCVDIDDTILYTNIINGEYIVNDINIKLIKKINKEFELGCDIILQTGRHWNHIKKTKEQLFNANIKYTTLVMGGVVADKYINDKGVTPEDFLNGSK